MVLEECPQCLGTEPNILVKSVRFDVVVIDADPTVRVTDRDVECEVIMERVGVVGVVELRERCIGHVELDNVGAYDEPEEKSGDCNDEEDEG